MGWEWMGVASNASGDQYGRHQSYTGSDVEWAKYLYVEPIVGSRDYAGCGITEPFVAHCSGCGGDDPLIKGTHQDELVASDPGIESAAGTAQGFMKELACKAASLPLCGLP